MSGCVIEIPRDIINECFQFGRISLALDSHPDRLRPLEHNLIAFAGVFVAKGDDIEISQ